MFAALITALANFSGRSDADPAAPDVSAFGRSEVWGGVDAAHDQWLAYSGMTVAPWSGDIYSDGWRIRVAAAYGQYRYDGDLRYIVDRSYTEALIGYYMRLGDLTAKAFSGPAISTHLHYQPDPNARLDGTQYGAKAALELWWNVTDVVWTSLDISATQRRSARRRRTGVQDGSSRRIFR